MGRIKWLFVFALLAYGGWWFYNSDWNVSDAISQYIENAEIVTLESRYTPEYIMDKNKATLIPNNQYSYEDPETKYYPYLLIDVKYTQPDKKTKEGSIIWSLSDGEMVVDTETWEKTHGFEDAINANASRTDFKILNALAKNNGSCSKEKIQQDLHLESDTIDPWIKSVCQKHLVIMNGNDLVLHLENPKILVIPETKIKQAFVNKPYIHSQKNSAKYSRSQIERIAQAAFGPTFTIRNVKELYLPVYTIIVRNPDDSLFVSYWNAVNSQRIK